MFPSDEDALEFLKDYDLDEARVKLLKELGRILEVAEIHARNGDLLKAVEMLTASSHDIDHARPAIEYLLTGLRRDLTLRVPSTPSPIVPKLLKLGDRLNKSAMTEEEIAEASSSHPFDQRVSPYHLQLAMFKAIQRADRASLRTLAKKFIKTGNDPTALLCLDHFFSSPLKLINLSFVEIQASLSLYLDYVSLLNKFGRDKSLAEGSNHQRLFGFQVLGEDRYLAPKHTLVHEKLTSQSGTSGKSVDGYRCSHDELSWGIAQVISGRIRGRTEIQNSACRDVHGFSPCLYWLVQKRCNPPEEKGPCPFQHIQLEQPNVDWYHARLRLILLQFQILNSARYYDWGATKYVPAHPMRNVCGYSLNVKLLAWDVVLSTSPTIPEARIIRKS